MSDKKPAMDFNEAFKAFDPKSMFPFLAVDRLDDWSRLQGFDSLDPAAMANVHQGRLQALAQANEQAMALYRLQVERQSRIFDAIMSAARENLKRLDASGGAQAPKSMVKVYSDAMDRAVALMQRLSEETLAAALEAHERISDQVDAAADDLRRS